MIRVLHVIGGMNRAGAETMLMNVYREIDRSLVQFDFVYFTAESCDFDAEIEALGGRVVRLPGNPISRFGKLFRALRAGDWRIVHSHTLFSSGLHLLAARLAGVPRRIVHSHSTEDNNSSTVFGRAYQSVMRRLLSMVATDFFACGVDAANNLFPGRTDTRIIPNAIDFEQFSSPVRDDSRNGLGVLDSCLVIVQIGRLERVKNQLFSLQIAEAIRTKGIDFRLLLIGRGPDFHTISAAVEECSLANEVQMLGIREDIAVLMAAADVMLMPSLHEGLAVVVVEAQASGLPSVLSSAVTSEVDFGLGLVNFVDLSSPPSVWADKLIAAAAVPRTNLRMRRKQFAARGYMACSSAELLTQIYVD